MAKLKRRDFNRICSRPPADRARYFKLFTDASPSGEGRAGVSVSSRVGKATVRNRVRRRLKTALREKAHLAAKTDVIIVARPGIERLSYAALCDLLERSLTRASGRERRPTPESEHDATDKGPAGSPHPAVQALSVPAVAPIVQVPPFLL